MLNVFITIVFFHTVTAVGPFLDNPPVNINAILRGSLQEKIDTLPSLIALMKTGKRP